MSDDTNIDDELLTEVSNRSDTDDESDSELHDSEEA